MRAQLKDARNSDVDLKGTADRLWKRFQDAYEKVTDFVDRVIYGSSDEEEDFEAFKKITWEDLNYQ
jgi:hypothetical protein